MSSTESPGAVASMEGLGPLPEPTLESHEYELWGQNVRSDFYTAEQMRSYASQAVAAERERWRQAGWVCADGFPALLGHKPLKPGAKLYALPNDWAAHGA